jgi:tetratricopeptide (TPR) repeat protein
LAYRRLLAIEEEIRGPNHADTAKALERLGWLFQSQNRLTEAEALHRRALDISEHCADNATIDAIATNLGLTCYQQSRYSDAEPFLQRALTLREAKYGPKHTSVADALSNLVLTYDFGGKHGAAEHLFERALCIHEEALNRDLVKFSHTLSNLASHYERRGHDIEAASYFRRALSIQVDTLGPNHPNVQSIVKSLSACRDKLVRSVSLLNAGYRVGLTLMRSKRGIDVLPGPLPLWIEMRMATPLLATRVPR